MGAKWTARSVQVNLGKALHGAPPTTSISERQRYRGWRSHKPENFALAASLRCSVAAQTTILLLFSACMLLYVILSPIEQDGWPEQAFQTGGAYSRLLGDDVLTNTVSHEYSAESGTSGGAQPLTEARHVPQPRSHMPHLSSVSFSSGSYRERRLEVLGPSVKARQTFPSAEKSVSSREVLPNTSKLPTKTNSAIRILGTPNVQVFADPTGNYFPAAVACRIYNACITKDGGYLLPKTSKQHTGLLAYCGLSKIQFGDLPKGGQGNFKNKDMFSNVLRYHMPHLATDVLSLSYAMSIVSGNYRMGQNFSRHRSHLTPIVQAQERVRTLDPSSWTRKLLSKLPFDAEVITPQELFPENSSHGSVPVCFRSVIPFDSQVYWQVSPSRFNEENALFRHNRLWSRIGQRPENHIPLGSGDEACSPVVVVLNRPPGEQRTLQNIESIRDHFEKLKTNPKYNRVAGAPFVVKYMNTTFFDQVSTIQEADVILASHGAALANLLFARIGTPVIEVFPFTYYANIFERMAGVMGLTHEKIVADPDHKGFFSCIVKQNTDKDAPSVRNSTALKALEEVWHKASGAFKQRNDHTQFVTHHQSHGGDLSSIDGIRMCARNQVLQVDAQDVAERLMRLVDKVCSARVASNIAK